MFDAGEIKAADGKVEVELTPWEFDVGALASDVFVPDVGFTLTAGSSVLGSGDYTIANASGTNKTTGAAAVIKLTADGWRKLHPNASTWNNLTLTWTSTPSGYDFAPGATKTVTVSESGIINNKNVRINLVPWTFNVGAGVGRPDQSKSIADTEFNLVLDKAVDGSNLLVAGTDYTPSTNKTAKGAFVKITLKIKGAEKVRKAGGLTLRGNRPTTGYNFTGGSFSQRVDITKSTDYWISLEQPTPGPTSTGAIIVTKQTRVEDGSRFYVPEKTGRKYYVTAFYDVNLQQRATNPAEVDVSYSTDSSDATSGTYSTAILDKDKDGNLLKAGFDYYLAETDAQGNVIAVNPGASDNTTIKQILFSDDKTNFAAGNSHMVRLSKPTQSVYLRNVYAKPGLTTGSFQIKLNVVDHENKPLASALTANFKVAGGDGTRLKNLKTIQLSNETTKTLKDISYRWSGDKIRITASLQTLTDASGASVLSSYSLVDPKTYAVLATGTAIPKYLKTRITLTSAEKNQQTLEFTLKKVKTEKEIAELKLTKAVTYKKTPIRVNGTYYIGIFSDAKHTKILYKKAMSLANASSMTSTLKINLYKLAAPHTITLYFAETDKNGKVVSSGSKSGYDISLNKTSVTLSPTNADESIVLTNDVRDGSVAAANLTNPSSGFAGDSSALAEAQALSNNETKSSKPTGDDTPFEPFAMATGISAGIIFLLLALLAARKKWGAQF